MCEARTLGAGRLRNPRQRLLHPAPDGVGVVLRLDDRQWDVGFVEEDVVGLLVHHLLSDVALAAHRIDGHDRPFDCHQIQQLGDRDDLAGLFRHLDLAEHEALRNAVGPTLAARTPSRAASSASAVAGSYTVASTVL